MNEQFVTAECCGDEIILNVSFGTQGDKGEDGKSGAIELVDTKLRVADQDPNVFTEQGNYSFNATVFNPEQFGGVPIEDVPEEAKYGAKGEMSFSWNGRADGRGSIAMLGGTAYGDLSLSIGGQTNGEMSVALVGSTADGKRSMAVMGSTAREDYQFALGGYTDNVVNTAVIVGAGEDVGKNRFMVYKDGGLGLLDTETDEYKRVEIKDSKMLVDGAEIKGTANGVIASGNLEAVSGDKVFEATKYTKTGGIKDWVIGSYSINDIVRYKGLLWIATTSTTTAEPSVHPTAWKLYIPSTKAPALLISTAVTLTINTVTNKAIFTGASTNKVVTESGVFGIPAQTIDLLNITYFCFIFNSTTGVVRTVNLTDNTSKSLAVDDYIIGYVLKLTEADGTVFGIEGYTFVKSTGTGIFPVKLPVTTDNVYNRNFDKYGTGRTAEEKEWLNKAIIDIKFFNLKDSQSGYLYGIGKRYGATELCYLGLIIFEQNVSSKFLYADELNSAFNMPYDVNIHTGVKTYLMREVITTLTPDKTINSNIYAQITVDWDAIPVGKRVVEANSNVNNNNSKFLPFKTITSFKYNNLLGKLRFASSRSFNDYYSSPTLESYASAEGVNSMIPKSPYEKVENWYLKWDELVTNKPLGYEITKQVLTTQVPTDTTESGFLPIYSYSFKPNKLNSGDPTGNNAQTLPKILIDCSIHGFEKTPSFVVYEFLKQMLNNWRSSTFLEYLRFNVEFIVIPSMNPHGWNALGGIGTRTNFNQVDLNRNNRIGWTLNGVIGDSTYSGASPLSEIEAQKLSEWITNNNTGNVIMGIDFHNFHGQAETDPKKYNMVWIVNKGTELGQSCSNVLIKELSVKYKDKSTLIPQTDDYFIGVSNNFTGGGQVAPQYTESGALYGCTFEVCQNFRFDPLFKGHDSNSITFGVESFVNFIRVYLSNFIEEYNHLK